MTLDNIDDELAEYGFGAIAVVALAALIYTESVPVPEAWKILIALIATVAGVGVGKHREKKKTNAPDIGDFIDTLLTAFDASAGPATDEKARVSETSASDPRDDISIEDTGTAHIPARAKRNTADSQTGTPADHTAAESEKTPVESTTDLRTITGIGPTYADLVSGAEVRSVEELATANTAALEASTGIPQARLDKWQQQANELTANNNS